MHTAVLLTKTDRQTAYIACSISQNVVAFMMGPNDGDYGLAELQSRLCKSDQLHRRLNVKEAADAVHMHLPRQKKVARSQHCIRYQCGLAEP